MTSTRVIGLEGVPGSNVGLVVDGRIGYEIIFAIGCGVTIQVVRKLYAARQTWVVSPTLNVRTMRLKNATTVVVVIL